MKAKLLIPRRSALPDAATRYPPDGMVPAGTILDHPDVYRLVKLGVAVPADEECDQAAGMTAQQMAAAQYAHRKVALGIHPDDYPAYDAGLMRGYNRDGSWIPGPEADVDEDDEDFDEEF